MGGVKITEIRPGLSVKQVSSDRVGLVVPPISGESDLGSTWVDFGSGGQPISDGDLTPISRHIRLTVRRNPHDPADDLKLVGRLRRDLWADSRIEVDPESPASQTRRDERHDAFFEFATEYPGDVQEVLRRHDYRDRVTVQDLGEVGLVCMKCGYLAGYVTECPNCKQRDISRCPCCEHEVARERYQSVAGDLFVCPDCRGRVRLLFNDIERASRSVSEPIVLVEDARRLP